MNTQRLLIAIFLCIAPTFAVAQEVRGPSLWEWTDKASHHDSIVKVSLDGAVGTGVVVFKDHNQPAGAGYLGRCLTANHVVAKDNGRDAIRVKYRNGRVAKNCEVIFQDEQLDVAILRVWIPRDIQPAKVAKARVLPGDKIEITGLGGGSKLKRPRHFRSRAADPTDNSQIYANVSLLPGDSGGAVFNKDKELVGIVSGGWFWWHDSRVTSSTSSDVRATWPARACNLEALQSLITKTEELAKREDPSGAEPLANTCLLYTSPSPRDKRQSRMPSSA